jgi:hypothetical protein
MKDREEYLVEAQERALYELDKGKLEEAVESMLKDLAEHPETKEDGERLAMLGRLHVSQGNEYGVREWIEGFK